MREQNVAPFNFLNAIQAILQNLLERNQGDIFFSYLQTADAIYGRCICDNSEIGGWVGRAIELSCDGALFEIRHVQQWSNTFPAV